MTELIQLLRQKPVIAAVRDAQGIVRAAESDVGVIFLLGGDLFTLPEWVAIARARNKRIFIHLDLVDGISRDASATRWVARIAKPDGVLSTRAPLLKQAAEEGLWTVLRMFMVDSSSLDTGVRMVKGCAPDLVEVMPGLVVRAIKMLGQLIAPPVIAGGMLELRRDVDLALAAGAIAASTSNQSLWQQEGWQDGKSGL